MVNALPERLDLRPLGRAERRLRGKLPLAGMSRLADILIELDGSVDVDLSFATSANGTIRIEGHVSLVAEAACQRCLEPVRMNIEADVKLAYVEPDSTSDCGDQFEVVDFDGTSAIDTRTFVEDEIVVALPDFPRHPFGQCTAHAEVDADTDVDHPFAELKQLKSHAGEASSD
ncbi:MAG: YceD family protein [Gammaproteobacteria bacterium]|nr:YceD family protein [Gammaproteobacteria bacterium]